jgi:putative transposase
LSREKNRLCQALHQLSNGALLAVWCSNGLSLGMDSVGVVIVTRVVKLLPRPEQASALAATLRACNIACGLISEAAHTGSAFDRNGLQKAVYQRVRQERGLGAQAAVRCVKKVVDAYTTLHAQVRAGLLGREGDGRRVKALGSPIVFGPYAAQPFDDRMLSWRHDARTVSIWTVSGRLRDVAFTGEPGQLKQIAEYRRGESDLVFHDGMWFLHAACEEPAAELNAEPVDFVGVDRGMVNLATTSDGINYSGRKLARYQRWAAKKRAELQAKETRSAKRLLANRRKREARHAAHVNHRIAKEIVSVAQRTERGIALEDLQGIRERGRFSRDRRDAFHTWPFHQLGTFLQYKALRAGVAFIEVDAHYTSQRCPRCGHTERANRPERDLFCCRRCGLAGPADHVAAVNVRERARVAWAFVNTPAPAASGPA